MEIGRKIYYEKSTGNVLVNTGEHQGAVKETTIDQDFQLYKALQDKTKDSVGVIQLNYGQLLDKFQSCTGYSIDITKNPIDASAIVFSFTTPEATLEEVKKAKISELENDCTKTKDGGFKSSCLGTEKIFDSSSENRTLIVGLAMKASLIASGAKLTDSTINWKAKDDPVCYAWTPQQMITLGVDLSTFMTNTIKRKEELQQYVSTLTTVLDVQKVTWDTAIPSTTDSTKVTA
jgi:hypothetical protein